MTPSHVDIALYTMKRRSYVTPLLLYLIVTLSLTTLSWLVKIQLNCVAPLWYTCLQLQFHWVLWTAVNQHDLRENTYIFCTGFLRFLAAYIPVFPNMVTGYSSVSARLCVFFKFHFTPRKTRTWSQKLKSPQKALFRQGASAVSSKVSGFIQHQNGIGLHPSLLKW